MGNELARCASVRCVGGARGHVERFGHGASGLVRPRTPTFQERPPSSRTCEEIRCACRASCPLRAEIPPKIPCPRRDPRPKTTTSPHGAVGSRATPPAFSWRDRTTTPEKTRQATTHAGGNGPGCGRSTSHPDSFRCCSGNRCGRSRCGLACYSPTEDLPEPRNRRVALNRAHRVGYQVARKKDPSVFDPTGVRSNPPGRTQIAYRRAIAKARGCRVKF
jgi:hypothetical protein